MNDAESSLPRGATRTKWRILALFAGVIIIAIIGWTISVDVRAKNGANDVLLRFFEALSTGDAEVAHGLLTDERQQHFTEEELAFAMSTGPLRPGGIWTSRETRALGAAFPPQMVCRRGYMDVENERFQLEVSLRRDDDRWAVYGVAWQEVGEGPVLSALLPECGYSDARFGGPYDSVQRPTHDR